jgi:hypothetical protein
MLMVFCQAVFFRDEKVEPHFIYKEGMYSWHAWQDRQHQIATELEKY